VKLTEELPPATVTRLFGTVNAGAEGETVTVAPPAGVGPDSPTVQVVESGGLSSEASQRTDVNVTASRAVSVIADAFDTPA
jgi:hypothetical protein